MTPAFADGDRVVWSHDFATAHASGSILLADAVADPGAAPGGWTLSSAIANPDWPQAGSGQRGTVKGDPANDAGTWFTVELDNGYGTLVLTQDEIVKIDEAV